MEKINFQDYPSTDTPINSTNLNGLQDNVEADIGDLTNLATTSRSNLVSAINNLASGEIVGSVLQASAGYIKYSNGFMLQWQEKNSTVSASAYGNLYYADITMSNWAIPFTTIFQAIASVEQAQWLATIGGYGSTNPGLLRVYRPNTASSVSVKVKVFAFGLWK